MPHFGHAIAAMRKAAGLGTRDFAERAGIKHPSVSVMEKKEFPAVRPKNLQGILNALKIDFATFIRRLAIEYDGSRPSHLRELILESILSLDEAALRHVLAEIDSKWPSAGPGRAKPRGTAGGSVLQGESGGIEMPLPPGTPGTHSGGRKPGRGKAGR